MHEVFSGIQTEVAFRPNFPIFRSKKFPTFRSTQLVAFRPVSGIQTEVAFRPVFPIFRSKKFPTIKSKYLWHSGQFPISRSKWCSDQISGDQTNIDTLIFRCLVFKLMCGVQAMGIPVLPFILVSRSTFCFGTQADFHRIRRILLLRSLL